MGATDILIPESEFEAAYEAWTKRKGEKSFRAAFLEGIVLGMEKSIQIITEQQQK